MKVKQIKATKSILINTGNYENVRFEYELTAELDGEMSAKEVHTDLTKRLNYLIRNDLHDMVMKNKYFQGDKNEWLENKYNVYGLEDE